MEVTMARQNQDLPAAAPATRKRTSRARQAVVADPPTAGIAERALGTEAAQIATGTLQGRAAVAGAGRTAKTVRAGKRAGDGQSIPEPDLRAELVRFVREHPEGWSHEDWMDLMERLTMSGYDTTDRDGLGLALERTRLDLMLSKVQGLGEKRRTAVLDRYPRLWNVQQASAEELAALPGITRPIAAMIVETVK
jgi:hypothetical protein